MRTRINVYIDDCRTTATVHSMLLAKAKNHGIDVQKVIDGHAFKYNRDNLEYSTVSQQIETILIAEICSAEFLAGVHSASKSRLNSV